MRKLFKNHNAIFQYNLINNSSNKVVLRFGCLSRGRLKSEINYSLSGIRKDHTSSHFLLLFKSFFKFIIFLFLAVLGLCCCAGCALVVVCGLLTAMTSLVAKHGL